MLWFVAAVMAGQRTPNPCPHTPTLWITCAAGGEEKANTRTPEAPFPPAVCLQHPLLIKRNIVFTTVKGTVLRPAHYVNEVSGVS